jgi:hypothetical protein
MRQKVCRQLRKIAKEKSKELGKESSVKNKVGNQVVWERDSFKSIYKNLKNGFLSGTKKFKKDCL